MKNKNTMQTLAGGSGGTKRMKRILFVLLCTSTSVFGSVIGVTDATLIPQNDGLYWNQFGSDQTSVHQISAGTSFNDSVSGSLKLGQASVVVACKDPANTAGCSYAAAGGIQSGDTLLKTDALTGEQLSLNFYGSYGVGGYIDSTSGAQFEARIQAYAGVNRVLDMTVSSDSLGTPIYLGVSDTLQEITKVVYSLGGNGGFALDTLYFQTRFISQTAPAPLAPVALAVTPTVGNPEPGAASLLVLGLLAVGFKLKRRKI